MQYPWPWPTLSESTSKDKLLGDQLLSYTYFVRPPSQYVMRIRHLHLLNPYSLLVKEKKSRLRKKKEKISSIRSTNMQNFSIIILRTQLKKKILRKG